MAGGGGIQEGGRNTFHFSNFKNNNISKSTSSGYYGKDAVLLLSVVVPPEIVLTCV